MLDSSWQLIAALVCVAAAALFLLRRAVKLMKGRSGGCGTGGCNTCPSPHAASASETARPFLAVEELYAKDGSRRSRRSTPGPAAPPSRERRE